MGDETYQAFLLLLDELSRHQARARAQIAHLAQAGTPVQLQSLVKQLEFAEKISTLVRRLSILWQKTISAVTEKAGQQTPCPQYSAAGSSILSSTSQAPNPSKPASSVTRSSDFSTGRAKRRYYGRLPKGARTTEKAFRRPILEILVESGGSADISEVLDKLEVRFRERFTEADLEPLPSNPRIIRWRHAAQWARYYLVRSGYMEPSQVSGRWEISEKGRRILAQGGPV